jgi:hypothetical protein
MLTFNFIPKARVCKKCSSDKHIKLVQLTNGQQTQKCVKCNCYV